jgi:hypothetical protein
MSDLKSAACGAGYDHTPPGAFDKKQSQSSGTDAPIVTVPSPCIDICKIDGNTGLCIGCLRTRDEIRGQLIDELSLRKAKLETEKAETP